MADWPAQRGAATISGAVKATSLSRSKAPGAELDGGSASRPVAGSAIQLDGCAVEHDDAARVADVRTRLPDEQTANELAETFRVLSDPGRLRLILALLEGGELCVCDLAAATDLSQTACSHNLRLLRSLRLVRYRRQGRNVYYAIDDTHIRLLLDVALAHLAHDASP